VGTAVVDIGSSACRLVVAEATGDGWFRSAVDRRVVLGLARTVRRDGQLGAGLTRLLEETVRRSAEAAFRAGSGRIVASVDHEVVAGVDGAALLERLRAALGAPVEVASPSDEVAAARTAVAARLGPAAPSPLVEVTTDRIRVAGDEGAHSLPVGTRDLLPRSVDPLHPAAQQTLRSRLDALLIGSPVAAYAEGLDAREAVLVGPPVVALARAAVGRRWGTPGPPVDGVRLSLAVLADLERELLHTSGTRRLLLPGLDPAEVDEVAVTTTVVGHLAAHLGLDGVVVSAVDAVEGRILRALHGGEVPCQVGPREAAVAAHATAHGDQVAVLAGSLVDQVGDTLGLGGEDRDRLVTAARLHDLGRLEGPTGPLPAAGAAVHRRGAEVLLSRGLPGVGPDELVELACLVRFQRGRAPGPHFAPYGRLPARRRRAIDRLTALLRVACGLDAGEDGVVVAVHVDVDPDLLCVHAVGCDDLDLALHGARQHAPLVDALLGRGLVLRAAGTPGRRPTARRSSGAARPDLVG
jgi:exopolyphosphatase/pppGpp-phosphohydrolase